MKTTIYILGGLQIVAGIAFASEASSAIHQILAAIAFGFGTVCIGLGGIITKLEGRSVQSPAFPNNTIAVTSKAGGWKSQ